MAVATPRRPPKQLRAVARPAKVATNLSLRADLVARARALGLNLSQVVEGALITAIRQAEQQRWQSENERAIDQYNAFVEEHGVFGEDLRAF